MFISTSGCIYKKTCTQIDGFIISRKKNGFHVQLKDKNEKITDSVQGKNIKDSVLWITTKKNLDEFTIKQLVQMFAAYNKEK